MADKDIRQSLALGRAVVVVACECEGGICGVTHLGNKGYTPREHFDTVWQVFFLPRRRKIHIGESAVAHGEAVETSRAIRPL